MTSIPVAFVAPDDAAALRLDQLLAREIPALGIETSRLEMSRREARRRLAAGDVYVNGGRVRVASRRLRPRARVEVWVEGVAPGLPTPSVLYLDRDLLAADKPSGLPTQATRTDAVRHLVTAVAAHLGRDGDRMPYLALHHRLDRGTSGAVLFARSRRANRGLAAAFAERRVEKLYLALVRADAPLDDAWTVDDRLAKRGDEGRTVMVRVDEGGKEARTDFRVRERFETPEGRFATVEARPQTGRTHQLRVHLAASGCPVLGDRKYGVSLGPEDASRLMLHAHRVRLEHPVTHEPLEIESPVPDDMEAVVNRWRR